MWLTSSLANSRVWLFRQECLQSVLEDASGHRCSSHFHGQTVPCLRSSNKEFMTAIWHHLRKDIMSSCNLHWWLIFLYDRSRTYHIDSLRAGPVGRISYNLYKFWLWTCAVCHLWFNKRMYVSFHWTWPHPQAVRHKVIMISKFRYVPYWRKLLGVSWSRTRNSDLPFANT